MIKAKKHDYLKFLGLKCQIWKFTEETPLTIMWICLNDVKITFWYPKFDLSQI